ncbi:hypothetical protein V3851_26010 [Paenibacillus sp. M1]|uniref:Uncharacterized protein n=1 Tax=Paenibacillus haidiansis TaxID=1574488 RepID=A0ABU7VZP7_9BACL
MYPISALYSDYLKRHDREFLIKAIVNGVEYTNAQIVDFSIENSLTLSDGFEIGTAIPSKLIIKLRLKSEIPSNAKIIPYLALSTEGLTWDQAAYPWQEMNVPWDGGSTEWLPLGEFFVDSREKVNNIWTFVCYDKLVTADVAYISQLSYPATMQAVWDEICSRLGFTYDSSVAINPGYTIQAGPAGYTCRQVLGYIAGANGASVFVSKAGVVKFKRFVAAAPAVFDLTTSDYIRAKQTNPIKVYSRVVVTYNTEDQLTYEAGNGDDNHTLNVENPFMSQAMVNNLQAQLNGFSYLPLSMDARGFPHLEHGDVIGFAQREGGSWLETITTWEETTIPWDGIVAYQSILLHQVLSFKGGLKLTLEAPSISDQQSEFALEGSLSQQVNRLNQNAVRYGKPYYGITHSRTEGFVVEREDHLSRLQLNSDVMDWKVDGESVLYLDAQARTLKFGGTLEAVDGIFTGTLQGVDGVFTGDLQAVGGTFTGTLQGVDGTFTGTLQAGTVRSSDIYSSYIESAEIEGGTITGSLIRTNYTGSRIELDEDGFVSYDSSNRRRVILGINAEAGMSGFQFNGPSGSYEGQIYSVSNALHIIADDELFLHGFGSVLIQGDTEFDDNVGIGKYSDIEREIDDLWNAIIALT